LEFDPNDRITVEESLAHPYLKALHFPEDEPCADPVNRRDFEFERSYLASEEIRALILREIQHYDAPKKKGESKSDGAGGEDAKGAKDDAAESKGGLGMDEVGVVYDSGVGVVYGSGMGVVYGSGWGVVYGSGWVLCMAVGWVLCMAVGGVLFMPLVYDK
jgi:hypothetical protein